MRYFLILHYKKGKGIVNKLLSKTKNPNYYPSDNDIINKFNLEFDKENDSLQITQIKSSEIRWLGKND